MDRCRQGTAREVAGHRRSAPGEADPAAPRGETPDPAGPYVRSTDTEPRGGAAPRGRERKRRIHDGVIREEHGHGRAGRRRTRGTVREKHGHEPRVQSPGPAGTVREKHGRGAARGGETALRGDAERGRHREAARGVVGVLRAVRASPAQGWCGEREGWAVGGGTPPCGPPCRVTTWLPVAPTRWNRDVTMRK